MDGLLLDTERAFLESFVTVCAPLGILRAQAEPFFLGLVGVSSATTTGRLSAFLPGGVDVAEFDRTWRDEHARGLQKGMPLRPDVAEVIPALHAAGHRMAVVTSTHRVHADHHLERGGLHHYFERIIPGDEVPANKPDPAPYVTAAKVLGVDPARCAAFEDSDTGTRAAVAAGCITTQIPDLRPAHVPLPDLGQHVADDLSSAVRQLGLPWAVTAA